MDGSSVNSAVQSDHGGNMARVVFWAGTAGFALGLSLAGVYTAGAAAADSSRTDGTPVSANSAGHSAKASRHPAARPAVKPAASALPNRQPVIARPSARRVNPPAAQVATAPTAVAAPAVVTASSPTPPTNAPSITIHNKSTTQTMWVYNLVNTGDYSIPNTPWMTQQPPPAPTLPPDWVGPVSIAPNSSAPVTLAVFNAAPTSAGNRIYIVEGSQFTLPVTPTSGIDPFYPPGFPGNDAFQNYSFVEYSFYQDGTYPNTYTIDVSYIDEWSLPIQTKFTIPTEADWTGAVSGRTYGFSDFDTVVSQLTAAGGPYPNLVSSGTSPYGPQPPASLNRIIGPDKVWTQQSLEPTTPPSAYNFNMNNTGWVPASYQNFVQYGFPPCNTGCGSTNYTYAYNGTGVSGTAQTNFDFWRYQITTPGATPYPIALRTAAILEGNPADANGAYGFFTYPNDETAGQFSIIPVAVSLDMYVWGSSDGVSASLTPGGTWAYTSSVAQTATGPRVKQVRSRISGTTGTDTFILNTSFRNARFAPVVDVNGPGSDIAVIDGITLGATSTTIDVVDRALFLGGGLSNFTSQFVYEKLTGALYYDQNPRLPGYTGVLASFPRETDPTGTLFVL